MIEFTRYTLANGLRLLIHEDRSTPMVAVSVQYDVGSRDESPERTGLAHLFEHLMFSGSKYAPSYDDPLQLAGGENNAFTNADITNFHVSVPSANLDLALWLEAGRMAALKLNQTNLDVQRKVVVEEFKETCLNEPYGDLWHHLSALCYRQHPYRWPTIGLEPKHIEEVSLKEAKAFRAAHYHVGNAIVAVAGNTTAAAALASATRLFADLPAGARRERQIAPEPVQEAPRRLSVEADVPIEAVMLAYPMCGRTDDDFYVLDLLTDVLAEGASSRLYRRLVKEQGLATTVDAYVTGTLDPGLLILEAKARGDVSLETLEASLLAEVKRLREELVPVLELEKVKQKLEASVAFSELSIVNRAINLCFYEGLGDVDLIHSEDERYQSVRAQELLRAAQEYLRPERLNVLYCRSKSGD